MRLRKLLAEFEDKVELQIRTVCKRQLRRWKRTDARMCWKVLTKRKTNDSQGQGKAD